MYHSGLMQRPEDDETRRSSNGASQNLGPYNARSPTQTDFPPQPVYHGTQSPVHSRHGYGNSSYLPLQSTVPLPLPLSSPTRLHPTSPLNATQYSSEYQSVPREKLSGNYYDPTFESRNERRPSESNAAWHNGPPPPPPPPPQVSLYISKVTEL